MRELSDEKFKFSSSIGVEPRGYTLQQVNYTDL